MRRRSFLVCLGAATAGCSGDSGIDADAERTPSVTPAPVPEDDRGRPGRVPPEELPGLAPENREPRPTEAIDLDVARGDGLLGVEERSRLRPVEGHALSSLTPAGRAFRAPPAGDTLDFSALRVIGGTAAGADDVGDPARFVEATDFGRETLVALEAVVPGRPARLSVRSAGRTVAGRLFLAATVRSGTWNGPAVVSGLARVRTTEIQGLLVLYDRLLGERVREGAYVDSWVDDRR